MNRMACTSIAFYPLSYLPVYLYLHHVHTLSTICSLLTLVYTRANLSIPTRMPIYDYYAM